MGRFYQTAVPEFVQDKMFQLPVDLMFQAIQNTDKNIDESIDKVDAFNGLLDVENLKTDDPAVNEKLIAYKDRIGDLSNKINKTPLDYRKYRTDIAGLSRELDSDLTTGVLGKAQEQKTNLDAELERVNKMTGVSNNRKELIKKAINNKYNQAGGLNYQDPNTYNAIDQFFVNPLEEFNEDDYINKIGANFEGDTSAKAWSNADNKGYIRDGSSVITIRGEQDVEDYVRGSLNDGVWEAQKRQMYELERDAGIKDYTDDEINQFIEKDKDTLINNAKNKLGFRKESKQSSLKGDSTYMQKRAMAEKAKQAGNGIILQEVRDARDAIKGEFAKTDKKLVDNINKKVVGLMGYESHTDVYEQVFTGVNKTEKIKEFRQNLLNQGIPYNDFVTYMNYNMGVEKLETPHPDGYDPTNPDDIQAQQNLLTGVVTAINNRNPNEEVKRIRTSTADGTYYETDFNSVGDMVTRGVDEGFIYLPATSTSQTKTWKTGPGGVLVDDENAPIINPKTLQPARTYEELIGTEQAKNAIVDTKNVSAITSEGVQYKADKGNVKQVKSKRINNLNQERNTKDYVVTNQYLKVNSETGKSELVNVDVYIDANKIGVKQ